MEDDDEFGDLYTDVLQNFPSSQPSSAPHPHLPIDLNLPLKEDPAPSREAHIPRTLTTLKVELDRNQNSVEGFELHEESVDGLVSKSGLDHEKNSSSSNSSSSNLMKSRDANNSSSNNSLIKLEFGVKDNRKEGGDFVKKAGAESSNFDVNDEKSFKFDDVEEETVDGMDMMGGSDGIIPGLGGGSNVINNNSDNFNVGLAQGGGGGDEWDSDDDSEDDLQIVLNDNNSDHLHGRGMGMRGDDEEDGEPLVIVADGDETMRHQGMEDQDWGEDGGQAADGEMKEMNEAGKANGGMTIAPKMGYSNQGYHPFHSQFKYVRPGAAPIPGAAPTVPGGTPGQARPLVNMGPVAGRGRGDWRPAGMKTAPAMQKSFHSGFGGPAWGTAGGGRGFGSGLDFTLPSHKTIFEVDIDGFEEKPWKHPGVDATDFFNFGLNEDSWKDYCKQLEQFRLESTMQSKIRVYESGRAEQEYDPDMPPELVAAAGITDVSAEISDVGKEDTSQIDVPKGPTRLRPALPPGRAIQVETSYSERLPSVDTRPNRVRDSDAIIEIVCQDSEEESPGGGVSDQQVNNISQKDLGSSHLVDDTQVATDYHDDLPHAFTGEEKGPNGRRGKSITSQSHDAPGKDEISDSLHHAGYSEYRDQTSGGSSEPHDASHEPRLKQGGNNRSLHSTSSHSSKDEKSTDNQKTKSIDSIDGKQSQSSSAAGAAQDLSIERIDAVDEENVMTESFEMEGDEIHSDAVASTGEHDNMVPQKKQKLGSQNQQWSTRKMDKPEDFKTARISEKNKVKFGGSRDYQNLHDDVEEEVLQGGRSTHKRSTKKRPGEDEQILPRRDRDGRLDIERNHPPVKGREDAYQYRDRDPSVSYQPRLRNDTYDRRNERESSDGFWQSRDEDLHGRRIRIEDSRKRERGDEMGSRNWGNIRDGDRIDRGEHLYMRKQQDNGSRRSQYVKDVGLGHREKDDSLKVWHENVDDFQGKRRKDEEYLRRVQAEKEEALHSHRESTSLRRRERSNVSELRKRDDQHRTRDNKDDHPSFRQKDDAWLERDREDRHRERDERHRSKQPHGENVPKREKEGREAARSGRSVEAGKVKDEHKGYQPKPKHAARHGDLKSKEVENEDHSNTKSHDDVYAQGNQLTSEERRLKHERSSTHNDHHASASDNSKVQDKKSKESSRKSRKSEDVDHNALGTSKKNQDANISHKSEMVELKNNNEAGKKSHEVEVRRSSSGKHKEDASSDDENQDSRRGRSKLERWASHKEMDFVANSKLSASSKVKDVGRTNSRSSVTSKVVESPAKPADIQPASDDKKVHEQENKDGDPKPTDDRHLDTVAKLKKRSERFKLPMPSEKETTTTRPETDAFPSSQAETPAVEAEVKPERPPRKRRWVSSQN